VLRAVVRGVEIPASGGGPVTESLILIHLLMDASARIGVIERLAAYDPFLFGNAFSTISVTCLLMIPGSV